MCRRPGGVHVFDMCIRAALQFNLRLDAIMHATREQDQEGLVPGAQAVLTGKQQEFCIERVFVPSLLASLLISGYDKGIMGKAEGRRSNVYLVSTRVMMRNEEDNHGRDDGIDGDHGHDEGSYRHHHYH